MDDKINRQSTSTKERTYLSFAHKLILSLAAIVAIFSTFSRMELDAALSVETNSPYLKSYLIADSTKLNSGIKLHNHGLGSLRISSAEIFKRGEETPIGNTSYDLQKGLGLNPKDFTFSPFTAREALQQGEERWLVKSITNSPEVSNKIKDLANEISIVVCYCSSDNKCEQKVTGVQIKPTSSCGPIPANTLTTNELPVF